MRHHTCPSVSRFIALALSLSLAALPALASPERNEGAPGGPVSAQIEQARTLVDAPYLRTVLPLSAFAYLRIPNVWGLLGAPTGNMFDSAVQSAPYMDAVLAIRSGMLENILPELPQEWRSLAGLLLGQLHSPLEIAVMAPAQDAARPQLPELLISASLDRKDPAAVNALLASLVAQVPGLALQGPLGSDGNGLLLAAGLPIKVFFDAAQRRLFLGVTGLDGDSMPLSQRVAALQPTPNHPMHEVEKGLDKSGQGLFLWLAPAPLLQAAEGLGKAREVAMLRAFGAAQARYLALGMGGSGGKQRMKVVLDMPQIGLRSFLPAIHTDLPFLAAGNPETLLMLGLPGTEDLARLEGNLRSLMPPEGYQEYQAAKGQLPEILGLTAEQLLAAFGHELLVIHDQAGYYAALRLRDPAAYQTLLQQLVQHFGLKHETRELLGTTFHHLIFASRVEAGQALASTTTTPDATQVPTAPADPAQGIEQRLVDHPSHLYWIEDQGYLVFAEVPQVLMDRLYITSKVAVAPWLHQAQGVDPSGALLLASTRTSGVPQLMYEVNLWLLTYLGDLTGHPVDLFSLPSAHQLHLPDTGAYSVQITSSPDQLGLELVYESNPIEALMAVGGMQTLIATGVLAAVAIPAYMKAESHAQLHGAMTSLQALQGRLAEFRASKGRFPSASEVDTFLDQGDYPDNADLQLEPATGKMTIRFYGEDLDGKDELILTPVLDQGNLRWQCAGTLNAKHIPSELCPP